MVDVGVAQHDGVELGAVLAQPAQDAARAFGPEPRDLAIPMKAPAAHPEVQIGEAADAHRGQALRDACVQPKPGLISGQGRARHPVLQP